MSDKKYIVINDEGKILIKQFFPFNDKRHTFVSIQEAKYSWQKSAYVLDEDTIKSLNNSYFDMALEVTNNG